MAALKFTSRERKDLPADRPTERLFAIHGSAFGGIDEGQNSYPEVPQ